MADLRLRLSVCCLLASALANAGFAQTPRYRFDGPNAHDRFGAALAVAGDVNADGFDDLIVGAPRTPLVTAPAMINRGSATVLSGHDGSVIHSLTGPHPQSRFGGSVTGLGDLDGDGHADFAIGAAEASQTAGQTGMVQVYSGASGSVIRTHWGSSDGERFGAAISSAGDFDDDGVEDLAIGAPAFDGLAGNNAGMVSIFSGADGALLWSREGAAGNTWFGQSLAGSGDIDADGRDDLIIGAPRSGFGGLRSGSVFVVSGATGQDLFRFDGVRESAMGTSVAIAGDVDRDGHDDIIAGAMTLNPSSTVFQAGGATVYSGANGQVVHNWIGTQSVGFMGSDVAGAGDVDGDGHPDLLVGIAAGDGVLASSGIVQLYSGATGSLLQTLDAGEVGFFGGSVLGNFDVDRDGRPETAVGASVTSPNGPRSGSVFVYSLGTATDPTRTWTFGAACRGSDGRRPRIGIDGRPAITEATTVTLRAALPNASTVLQLGLPLASPIDLTAIGLPGCHLAVGTPSFVFAATATSGSGTATATIPMVSDTVFLGRRFDCQWVVIDGAANALGLTFSQGLALLFGR